MKNHYIYEVVNNLNGMKYIGKRSCDCPIEEDFEYLGSGAEIKKAILEFGSENFTKKILEVFDDEYILEVAETMYIYRMNASNDVKYYNVQKGKTRKSIAQNGIYKKSGKIKKARVSSVFVRKRGRMYCVYIETVNEFGNKHQERLKSFRSESEAVKFKEDFVETSH